MFFAIVQRSPDSDDKHPSPNPPAENLIVGGSSTTLNAGESPGEILGFTGGFWSG
jgi:hypothetical protein